MILTRALQLLASVLRPAECAARERRPRICDARHIRIANERQDGVIKRRGADLDLPPRGGVTIRGENQAQEFLLLLFQGGLVILRVVLPLRGEPADNLIFLEPGLLHPTELREQLKVAPIALRKSDDGLRASRRTRPFVELDKTLPARHQVLVIHLESARENLCLVLARQLTGALERNRMPRLIEASTRVFLELNAQGGNHVESRVKLRKLAQRLGHAVVILEGMKARPREHVAAGFWVAILRLMHVPQHNQMNAIHSAGVRKRS